MRLESVRTGKEIAAAEHSGHGAWEQLCAIGRLDDEGPVFPGRARLHVASGSASFSGVSVETL